MRSGIAGSVLLLGLACQTYDFERVEPIAIAQTRVGGARFARKPAPNVMLLVDRSGSMRDSAVDGGAAKIDELKVALDSFLAQHGTLARMGLALFPSNDTCGATTSIAVALPAPFPSDDDAALAASEAAAQRVRSAVHGIAPGGGTPTGASLAFVGGLPGLGEDDGRDDFVVLLTDGLPNCNAGNVNTCASPAACRCTLSACGPSGNPNCALGCLDEDGAVSSVHALSEKGIGVFVVGFGSDTTGTAQRTLDAMAIAGGRPRECGGADGGCLRYYQSSSGDELATVLDDIIRITGPDPCEFLLDTPTPIDPKFLSVGVDRGPVLPGPDTWVFDPARNAVRFGGAMCDRLRAATKGHEVLVDIRALEWL